MIGTDHAHTKSFGGKFCCKVALTVHGLVVVARAGHADADDGVAIRFAYPYRRRYTELDENSVTQYAAGITVAFEVVHKLVWAL